MLSSLLFPFFALSFWRAESPSRPLSPAHSRSLPSGPSYYAMINGDCWLQRPNQRLPTILSFGKRGHAKALSKVITKSAAEFLSLEKTELLSLIRSTSCQFSHLCAFEGAVLDPVGTKGMKNLVPSKEERGEREKGRGRD